MNSKFLSQSSLQVLKNNESLASLDKFTSNNMNNMNLKINASNIEKINKDDKYSPSLGIQLNGVNQFQLKKRKNLNITHQTIDNENQQKQRSKTPINFTKPKNLSLQILGKKSDISSRVNEVMLKEQELVERHKLKLKEDLTFCPKINKISQEIVKVNKPKTSSNKWDELFLLSKVRDQEREIKYNESKDKTEFESLLKCTFKPNILTEFINKPTFYKRSLIWQKSKEDKIKMKRQTEFDTLHSECTFTPQVLEYPKNEGIKDEEPSKETMQFLFRHFKANNVRQHLSKLAEPRISMSSLQVKKLHNEYYRRFPSKASFNAKQIKINEKTNQTKIRESKNFKQAIDDLHQSLMNIHI